MMKAKLPPVMAPKYAGQIGDKEKYADPDQAITRPIIDMDTAKDDIGEMSGFVTEGYLDKKGTQYGEAAQFNYLPPGMEIANQHCVDIRHMEFKTLTDTSYPGDTPFPSRDIKETRGGNGY